MPTFTPARLLAVKEIPHGADWLYEPKFDGYRGLLVSNARRAGWVWTTLDAGQGSLAVLAAISCRLDGVIRRAEQTMAMFLPAEPRG